MSNHEVVVEENPTVNWFNPKRLKITVWIWYALPTFALLGLALREISGGEKDLAIATLGGQIGFLGFLFAIVTFIADTGVLIGTRGVLFLTKSVVPYFAFVLSGTAISAVAVATQSPTISKAALIYALLLAMCLPIIILHLAKRASAENVAHKSGKQLKTILKQNPFRAKDDNIVEHLLNDLRASAIRVWERGDLNGYRSLLSEFLKSIPQKNARRPEAKDLSHIKFLSMWIEMQAKEQGSLLFLANQISDEVIERVKNGDFEIATELMEQIAGTIRQTVDSGGHQEFQIHGLRILKELAEKIYSIQNPLISTHKISERNTVVQKLESFHAIGLNIIKRKEDGLFMPDGEVSIAIEVCIWAVLANTRYLILEDRVVAFRLVKVLEKSISQKQMISEQLVRTLETWMNEESSSRDEMADLEHQSLRLQVVSTADKRILMFAVMCELLQMHSKVKNFEFCSQVLRSMLLDLHPEKIDSGSCRYVEKKLNQLLKSLDMFTDFYGEVLSHLSLYVAFGKDRIEAKKLLRKLAAYSEKMPDKVHLIEKSIELVLRSQFMHSEWSSIFGALKAVSETENAQATTRKNLRNSLIRIFGSLPRLEESNEKSVVTQFACAGQTLKLRSEHGVPGMPEPRMVEDFAHVGKLAHEEVIKYAFSTHWADTISKFEISIAENLFRNGAYENGFRVLALCSDLGRQYRSRLGDESDSNPNEKVKPLALDTEVLQSALENLRELNSPSGHCTQNILTFCNEIFSNLSSVWESDLIRAITQFDFAIEIANYGALPSKGRAPTSNSKRRERNASLYLAIGEMPEEGVLPAIRFMGLGMMRSLLRSESRYEQVSQEFGKSKDFIRNHETTTDDKLAILIAHRFAASGLARNGRELDAGKIQLSICEVALRSTTQPDQIFLTSLCHLINLGCKDLQEIEFLFSEHDLVKGREVDEVAEGYRRRLGTIREVILHLNNLVELCVPNSSTNRSEQITLALSPTFEMILGTCSRFERLSNKTLQFVKTIEDPNLREKMSKEDFHIRRIKDSASQIRSKIGHAMPKSHSGERRTTKSSESSIPKFSRAVKISTALTSYVKEIEEVFERFIPDLDELFRDGSAEPLQLDVDRLSQKFADQIGKHSYPEGPLKFIRNGPGSTISDWEKPYVIAIFDSVVASLNSMIAHENSGPLKEKINELLFTNLGNCLIVRSHFGMGTSSSPKVQDFITSFSNLKLSADVPVWAVRLLFGKNEKDDCVIRDVLLYEDAIRNRELKSEVDDENFLNADQTIGANSEVRGFELSVLLRPLRTLIQNILLNEGDRRLSDLVHGQLLSIRSEVHAGGKVERGLVEILQLWDPYFGVERHEASIMSAVPN